MTRPVNSIPGLFQRYMTLTALVSVGLVCIVWLFTEYSAFMTESDAVRETFVTSQQEMLRREVSNVVNYIFYMKHQTEKRLRATIKDRVDEACAIALNIHRQNVDTRSPDVIKTMIRDALRPIRFNNRRGYYFAFTLDGIEELFADRPEMEGRNMLTVRGANGESVVKDMTDLVQEHGQGFYEYTWFKPGESKQHFRKISYVKLFDPYGWVIGTGDYIDDMKAEIQAEVLGRIVEQRFGEEGYFFGSTFSGEPLFTNGQITRGGPGIWDLTDPDGVKIIQEQKKAAEDPAGGFVNYSWKRLNSPQPSFKVSFVMGVPEWEWIIGAGVYIDSINSTIMAQKAQLFRQFRQKVLISLVLLAILYLVIFFWARNMTRHLRENIRMFYRFFEKARSESSPIEVNALSYTEFREIAASANDMLEKGRQATEDLRQSEMKYRTLFENMIQGVFYQQADGRLTDVNQSALDILGLSRDQFLGRTSMDPRWKVFCENGSLLQSNEHPSMVALTSGKPVIGSVMGVFNPLKERIVWVSVNALPRFVPDKDSPDHVVVTLADITEAKQAQEERQKYEDNLRQAQKLEAIGVLSGGIAHDFNNILASVMGFAELSLEDTEPGSVLHDNLTEISTAGKRASELVKQILAFGRKANPLFKTVCVNDLISGTVRMLRATTPTLVEIRQSICSRPLSIRADVAQIQQVLVNLITNAVHAIPETGGLIDIVLEPVNLSGLFRELGPGNYARIRVRDSGCGIPKENLDLIFDPYFTTKDVNKGSGLGLSVVHGIVASHGGSVAVVSAPGQGSTFDVYFPLVSDDAAPGQEDAVPADLPRGTERILLVDDETPIVRIQKAVLERSGYQVTEKNGSLEALEAFRREPLAFDLLVTDMTMPHMTGLGLTEAVRKLRKGMPVILCTGYSEHVTDDRVLEQGLTVLMKPVDKSLLITTVRKVLDQAGTGPDTLA
ncbi:MAG: cache domain-containing protein [Pseudomonadota bacterium]